MQESEWEVFKDIERVVQVVADTTIWLLQEVKTTCSSTKSQYFTEAVHSSPDAKPARPVRLYPIQTPRPKKSKKVVRTWPPKSVYDLSQN